MHTKCMILQVKTRQLEMPPRPPQGACTGSLNNASCHPFFHASWQTPRAPCVLLQMRCFDVSQLSMKFDRHFDSGEPFFRNSA